MRHDELQAWLTQHCGAIMYFMDYEATIESDESLSQTLDAWFNSDAWRASGHRFIHLGIDGRGGQFALWVAPESTPPYPVVLFGSEGEVVVLCANPQAWAQIIAHAPGVNDFEEPARVVPADDDDDPDEEAAEALERYRRAVNDHFGTYASLDDLTRGLDALNTRFLAWINAHLPA